VSKNPAILKRKRIKTVTHPDLDEALVVLIEEARARHISINGPIVHAKERKLPEQLSIQNIVASEGWLQKLKKTS
jgi:hypothetical protein